MKHVLFYLRVHLIYVSLRAIFAVTIWTSIIFVVYGHPPFVSLEGTPRDNNSKITKVFVIQKHNRYTSLYIKTIIHLIIVDIIINNIDNKIVQIYCAGR